MHIYFFKQIKWKSQFSHLLFLNYRLQKCFCTKVKLDSLSCLLTYDNQSFDLPGLTTTPGGLFITRSLPSRCFNVNWKPHKASVRERLFVQYKSLSLRVNSSCSFCCKIMITSPGSMSGCQKQANLMINTER